MPKNKIMKKLVILGLLVYSSLCYSQKQGNIWYFGDHAGLDFSTGNPLTINDGQIPILFCPACHSEGTAVICDSSGSLLFYTNGNKVWNKDHQVMANGDSLLSNGSSTQGALIIPKPGSSRFYYLFTTDAFFINDLQYGFRYNIIDMCLDNGHGDIIGGQKNILLLDTVCEKLTGVRHSNGIDYWVIVHKFWSDAFYSYHLSNSGIIDTVISHVGTIHPKPSGQQITGTAIGQMKASPNGQKLALVNGNANYGTIAEYFDFNSSNGVVSNCVNIQTDTNYAYYGVSFSPDNSKLYIACYINGNGIYQYDLNAGGGNPDSVRTSCTQIANPYFNFQGLQLANNGKIYATRSPYGVNPYMDVVNFPNNPGSGCGYVDSAVYLDGHASSHGLPNFIDSYDYSNTVNTCYIGIENNLALEDVVVYPNPSTKILTIEFIHSTLETYELTLFNSYGETIPISYVVFEDRIIIERNGQKNGLYFFQIGSKEKIIAKGRLIFE